MALSILFDGKAPASRTRIYDHGDDVIVMGDHHDGPTRAD